MMKLLRRLVPGLGRRHEKALAFGYLGWRDMRRRRLARDLTPKDIALGDLAPISDVKAVLDRNAEQAQALSELRRPPDHHLNGITLFLYNHYGQADPERCVLLPLPHPIPLPHDFRMDGSWGVDLHYDFGTSRGRWHSS